MVLLAKMRNFVSRHIADQPPGKLIPVMTWLARKQAGIVVEYE